MKKFIHKTNTYLIENHPTIWNTRLVWMLITALGFHIAFFILGYIALSDPETLHHNRAKSIFFENGSVFISIIISILMLVVWLIYLFKNNAFKNFYPNNKPKVFKQFICFLIIIFSSITFFLSHAIGLKTYIASTYNDDRLNREIQTANDAALFFSEKLDDYTLNNRRHPAPFDSLYAVVKSGSYSSEHIQVPHKKNIQEEPYIARHSKYKFYDEREFDYVNACLTFLDDNYCFYTLKHKKGKLHLRDNDSTYNDYVFYKEKDSSSIYYFKDSVVNISKYAKSAKPTYYNYSETFYISKNDTLLETDKINYRGSYNHNFSIRNALRSKRNYELLKRNNPNEIKQLLSNFLNIADAYKINKNLTTKKWFKIIYNPNNFSLNAFIRTEPKPEYAFSKSNAKDLKVKEKFYQDRVTDLYIQNDDLNRAFTNIEDIKRFNPFEFSIHFFIWLTIFLSSIIFMFRITGLKALLFTTISIGVLGIFITLTITLFEYISHFSGNNLAYFASYLLWGIGTIILAIPIFYAKKMKKIIVGICLNISIIGFSGYVFLIITIISLHQTDSCFNNYNNNFDDANCFNLLGSIGVLWSFILFIIQLVFIYFYSKTIKNWKALPEG